MKFKIYWTKLGHQFFFINNLAAWSPLYRKRYNQQWLKIGGVMKKKEKNILKEISPIFKKFTNRNIKFKPNHLDVIFLDNQESQLVWQKIAQLVSQKELKILKKTFVIFQPRFEKIWRKNRFLLEKTVKNLEKILESQKMDNILLDLSNFYQTQKPPNNYILNICFIYIPLKKGGGGKPLKNNLIVLERGLLKEISKGMNNALLIILHELIHAKFESTYFHSIIAQFIRKKTARLKRIKIDGQWLGISFFLKELVAASLTPEGYLAEKYFDLKVKDRYKKYQNNPKKFSEFQALRRYAAYYLYPLTKKYIGNAQKIDFFFLENVFKILCQFKKNK